MNQKDRDDLQRWLDGDVDEQGRAAFEQRIAEDPELRAELELHRRVDESLQRSFAVPPIAAPHPSENLPAGPAQPPRWPLFLAGALSAAAVLLVWLQPWSQSDSSAVMRTAVGRSWLAVCGPNAPTTEGACASPSQVTEYVQPLAPELPSTLVWRDRSGVRFERGLEPRPQNGLRVLELTVMPTTEVYLFVVPASADPRPALPQDTDWKLFRKACGPLVVYELTPLDKSHGLQCVTERH